ncbi:MAG: hypothetical protein ACK56I_29920, partial [bacterium]
PHSSSAKEKPHRVRPDPDIESIWAQGGEAINPGVGRLTGDVAATPCWSRRPRQRPATAEDQAH